MEISPDIQLAIERAVTSVKNEARQEAEKARNQAIGVLGFVALVLSLAGGLGISEMIKTYSTSAAKDEVKKSTGAEFVARSQKAAFDAEYGSSRVKRMVTETEGRLDGLKKFESWLYPKLEPGWQPYAQDQVIFNPPGYFKDALGFVHLRGLVTGTPGTPGTNIIILPVGYRPEFRHIFSTLTNDGTPGRVDVKSGGEVYFESGDSKWVSLDSVSFLAARESIKTGRP